MKALRVSLIITVAAVIIMGLGGAAYAFHTGGVADCEGCHTMHNSYNNQPMGQGSQFFPAGSFLLQGSDQSSTCLNCHATFNVFTGTSNGAGSFHIMTYPTTATSVVQTFTPGGDFGWLGISTTGIASFGESIPNPGTRHGHNIIAADYGLFASTVFPTSPGGTYPSTLFYCSSCHDPHGQSRLTPAYTIVRPTLGLQVPPIYSSGSYGAQPTLNGQNGGAGLAVGVYRLLAGTGYQPVSLNGFGSPFANNSIVAVAPSSYNSAESAFVGAGQTIVAYGQGISPWCGNCHGTIHANGQSGIIHPTGVALTGTQINIYNAYVYSGNLTGAKASAYSSLVPFERDSVVAGSLANLPTLATYASSATATTITNAYTGPSNGDQVVCLSCHRAHAEGWKAGLRWQTSDGEFITINGFYPGTNSANTQAQGGQFNLGYTQEQVQATYYNRPVTVFASYQRSLCNKCHGKD